MGITLRTPIKDITNESLRQLQAIEDGIINRLDICGAEFMQQAKDDLKIDTGAFPAIRKPVKRHGKATPVLGRGEYYDDSKNLRNSIGYYVLKDGVIVRGRVEGGGESQTAAMEVLNSVPKIRGYQLVGVAGMNYASYLESKGFNVITSQAFLAMTNVEGMIRRFAKAKNAEIDIEFGGLQSAMR